MKYGTLKSLLRRSYFFFFCSQSFSLRSTEAAVTAAKRQQLNFHKTLKINHSENNGLISLTMRDDNKKIKKESEKHRIKIEEKKKMLIGMASFFFLFQFFLFLSSVVDLYFQQVIGNDN